MNPGNTPTTQGTLGIQSHSKMSLFVTTLKSSKKMVKRLDTKEG